MPASPPSASRSGSASQASPGASGEPGAPVSRPGWRIALSLFTVIPVGGDGELSPGDGARALRWLPAVGLLLGLAGAGVVLGVGALNGSGPGRALGAALAVALVAF